MPQRILLFLCMAGWACAQVTAPPQSPDGPGGSGVLYNVTQSGPYNAKGGTGTDSFTFYIFTPTGMQPGPGNPNPLPTPASAPVILFLHGYDGDTLQPYLYWMQHMTRMGATVVWVLFDQVPVAQWDQAAVTDWKAALSLLTAPTPGLVPPTMTPANQPLTFIVGHSSGAYITLKVANEAATSGIPIPAGVLAVEPGEGQIPTFTPTSVNASTVVMLVAGDGDNGSRLCLAPSLWSQMTQIPAAQKPFVLMRSDSHGTPAQLGNHWFPLTNTTHDDIAPPVTVDNRDWNVTYKFSTAMVRCLQAGQYCDYLYGNGPVNGYGATTQTDMGVWSDGVPVLPMLNIADPAGYYHAWCRGK